MLSQATYIWIDGHKPTQHLRSKVRVVDINPDSTPQPNDFPEWGFDGSSTYQAEGDFSDLVLQPVCCVANPLSIGNDYLVLCEVYDQQGQPHQSNTRAKLRQAMDQGGAAQEPWIGFEQEYTLFDGHQPLGWPVHGYPAPQGPFYCGVGADEVYGREFVDKHADACIDAGLMIFGTNAEVMPGQWEFQIGYRDIEGESADPLTVSDHLWIARWLMYRIGEEYNITVKLDPKPVPGDWNGAGKHTNFSTKDTRDPQKGRQAIEDAVECLKQNHQQHISNYGHNLDKRLTGLHETAPIDKFSHGSSNRGASIRIPAAVAQKGYGYLEDRRPGANADPYVVSTCLIQTICLKKPVSA